MVMTDPIADFLTRVRNANMIKHDTVEVPASKVKIKYGDNNQKVISGLKRISKPSLRVYCKKDEVPKVLGGLGVAVISTSQGIVTDKVARKNGLGGEVICYVW